MGTPRIYIGSHDVFYGLGAGEEHLYLFYDMDLDGDDDPTTSDGDSETIDYQIIRGDSGLNYNPALGNNLVVETRDLAEDSLDWFGSGETADDRNFRVLLEGQTAIDAWEGSGSNVGMLAFAQSLGTPDSTYPVYNTYLDPGLFGSYNPFGPNSNSVINTVLNSQGIDLRESTPFSDGITSDYQDPREFPGHMGLLDGSGADSLTAFAHDGIWNTTFFIDQEEASGTDTIRIEEGAALYIVGGAVSDIEIVLEGSIAGGVSYHTVNYDDLIIQVDGETVAFIEDGMSLGVGIDLNLKHDDGSTITTLKDLTDLDSTDLSSISIYDIATWLDDATDRFLSIPTHWDPLVIDLDNDGLTTDATGLITYFDLDSDGFAELTGWHNGDDGHLVRDINSNGRIDNGSELFGSQTVSGFAALAAFDANNDGLINSSDAVWSELQIWQDKNADGQTQSDELLSLASLDIVSFDIENAAYAGISTSAGFIGHTSTASTSSGSLDVGDFNYARNSSNSKYVEDFDFDVRAAFLPNIRGLATISELHIALSLDNDTSDSDSLMSIAQDIASYNFSEILENWSAVKAKIEDLLYRWAEVDDVDLDSRGPYVNARQVGFIEKYLGQQFIDASGAGGNLGIIQAEEMEELWNDDLFPHFLISFLSQLPSFRLVDGTYILEETRMTGVTTIDPDALDELEIIATNLSTTAEREDFWVGVGEFLLAATESNNSTSGLLLSSTEQNKLKTAIENSDASLTWDESDHDIAGGITSIEYRLFHAGDTINGDASANDYTLDPTFLGSVNADIINGFGGDDVLNGNQGDDIIDGGEGNDTLIGGGGFDILIGGNGGDYLRSGGSPEGDQLFGGEGNDILEAESTGQGMTLLEGGNGDDEYRVGANAWIDETTGSGDDTIRVRSGVVAGDLTYGRLGNGDLIVNTNGYGSFYIRDHFNSGSVPVETITFVDGGPDVDLTTLNVQVTTNGTEFDDTIDGVSSGGSNIDTINAGEGNDVISAGDGDDTVNGEEGNDEIDGGAGNDTLNGGIGDDIYIASAGNDSISEGNIGDYDILKFEDATVFDDLVFTRSVTTSTVVLTHSAGTIDIIAGIYYDKLDEFQFADGSSYLASEVSLIQNGTASGEVISGMQAAFGENDVIFGMGGNDTLVGRGGDDILDGGDGNDILRGDAGIDTVSYASATVGVTVDLSITTAQTTGQGSDTITNVENIIGSAYADTLTGDANANVLTGGEGADALDGGAGDDSLIYADTGSTIDSLDGGADTDTADFSGFSHAVWVNLAYTFGAEAQTRDTTHVQSGTWREIATLDNIENVIGTVYDDELKGDGNANSLEGGSGSDSLWGAGGSDFLYGEAGSDTLYGEADGDALYGGDGYDYLYGNDGADTLDGGADDRDELYGGAGDDTLIFNNTGTHIEYMDGGADTDTADFSSFGYAVWVNLIYAGLEAWTRDGTDVQSGTWREIANLDNIENLIGTAYADEFKGDSNANVFSGGNGTDTIYGREGNDTLNGDAGTDVLIGMEDHDILNGGADDDVIFGDGESLDESTYSYTGNDELYGGGGNDYMYGGTGSDTLEGGDLADVLYGGSGNDDLKGDAGDDTLYGDGGPSYTSYTGDDVLNGGAGQDNLYGELGDDVLWAGEGADLLYGGAGTNTFAVYETAGQDNDMAFIQDWNVGTDNVIDISDLLSGYNSGTDDLSDFVAVVVGSNTTIQVDRDGTGGAFGWDNVLRLQGISSFETNVDTLESSGTLIIA